MKQSVSLPQHRPNKYGTSLGCHSCVFNKTCGGLTNASPLFDCFDQYCCRKPDCDNVCPHNDKFLIRYSEISGFTINDLPKLRQVKAELPLYVPMIHHGSSRNSVLESSHVALSLYSLFSRKNQILVPRFQSLKMIRHHFRLSESAKIILCGTGKDRLLERYWSHRRMDQLADYLGTLDISLAIGPNYSSFLNVPRTDIQFNRKRQLICLAEMSQEGVSVVPHISVTMPADWGIWAEYLRINTEIQFIAFNFQTGFKSPNQGRYAIQSLAKLRDRVNRELKPILIGGTQFSSDCSTFFEKFTVVDSVPFAKTMKRYAMIENDKKRVWTQHPTQAGDPLDSLLAMNLEQYSNWIKANKAIPLRKSA